MLKFWSIMYQHGKSIGFYGVGCSSESRAKEMFFEEHSKRSYKVLKVIPCGDSERKMAWLDSVGEVKVN